jgi:hypothetical protein
MGYVGSNETELASLLVWQAISDLGQRLDDVQEMSSAKDRFRTR